MSFKLFKQIIKRMIAVFMAQALSVLGAGSLVGIGVLESSLLAGFLGMASGVCCAANFSKVPYVIIKHPEHHKKEMLDELGQNETYEFSHSCQRLLRSNQSLDLLTQSFNMIKEYNEFKKN